MPKPTFPISPFDGQLFVDQDGIQWVYDADQNSWSWIGPQLNLPVAKSGNQCEGSD